MIEFLLLDGPGGQYIAINPAEIVSVRTPRASDHMAKDVHCIVFTVDGKYTGVTQTCVETRQKIKEIH